MLLRGEEDIIIEDIEKGGKVKEELLGAGLKKKKRISYVSHGDGGIFRRDTGRHWLV